MHLSVTGYTSKTGILALQHAYPPPPHRSQTAWVDVNLLLSTMKTTDTQRGEWVNVVGYVEGRRTISRPESRTAEGGPDEVVGVKVQAVMLWSAGDVKLGQYEKTVVDRTRVLQGNQHPEDHEKNTT